MRANARHNKLGFTGDVQAFIDDHRHQFGDAALDEMANCPRLPRRNCAGSYERRFRSVVSARSSIDIVANGRPR